MMNEARRHALKEVSLDEQTHASLWLDRYLKRMPKVPDVNPVDEEDAKKARTQHIEAVKRLRVPRGYREAMQTRLRALWLEDSGLCVKLRVFQCVGRMVVGMGERGVLETGLRLERTWGVPLLPGPSLKGVAAAAAHKLVEDDSWRKAHGQTPSGESAAYLFGTLEQAGRVTFHDAWWLPEGREVHALPVHQDVMTPHQKNYYQERGAASALPDGTADPVPVSFLSASGRYVVVLSGAPEDEPWLDAAMELLTLGLSHLGIGAKTNAGYGKLQPDEATTDELKEQRKKHQKQLEQARLPLEALLSDVLAQTLQTPTSSKSLAENMHKLARGASDIQDAKSLFGNSKIPDGVATSFKEPGVFDALMAAMRANPVIQAWARGEDLHQLTKRRPNQLKEAARWVGLQDTPADAALTPSPAEAGADDPIARLLARHPEAASLPDEAKRAFAACLTPQGVEASRVEAIQDEVEGWGDEALELWFKLSEG